MLATADLLGRDLTAVHARLGNPVRCAFAGHELLLAYECDDGALGDSGDDSADGDSRNRRDDRDPSRSGAASDRGVVRPRAVVLVDGVVVQVLPRLRRRASSPFGGQLIGRVLPAFGPLLGMLTKSAGLELVFATCRVFVHEDRIAHVATATLPLGLFVLPGELARVTAAG